MRVFAKAALSAAATAMILPGTVSAQSVTASGQVPDMFSRNKNVSVQSRPRPDFEAVGARVGAFWVYPRLELQAESNDNIYANQAEVDDLIWRVRPEITAESNWNSHFLSAYVRGSLNRYADNQDENSDEFFVGAAARVDASRFSNIGFGFDYADTIEPRTSPTSPSNAREPVSFQLSQGFLSGSHTSGRVRISARGDMRTFDYEDGLTGGGAPIDQDYRDRTVTSLTGRVDYALSPDTAFFVQATGNTREYDRAAIGQPVRDSSGSEVVAGASFELSNVSRGEIAAGYIKQDFDDTTYDDFSGFGARAQVEWFVSELTTVTAAAGRTVEDAANPGVGGYLSTNANLRIDHELMRNVILTGQLIYGRDQYEDIDREDERKGAVAGVTYFVNRNVGVNLSASTMDTESTGVNRDRDYRVNKLAVSLVTQF